MTALQKANLISVHIRLTGRIEQRRSKVAIERLSWRIGEGSAELRASGAVVAKSTLINLPVALKFGRVENRRRWLARRMGLSLFLRYMGLAGPVTDLAGDARHKAVSIIAIALRIGGERMDVGCMALNTTGTSGTSKVRRAILIARAVDPLMPLGPVAYG